MVVTPDSPNSAPSRNWIKPHTIRIGIRSAAWIVGTALVLLTIVPSSMRPESGVSHHLEHFASFLLAGILYYLGYAGRVLPWLMVAVLFAGGLELLQILVPGRHARLVDFVVDALGASTGVVIGFLIVRTCIGRDRV